MKYYGDNDYIPMKMTTEKVKVNLCIRVAAIVKKTLPGSEKQYHCFT